MKLREMALAAIFLSLIGLAASKGMGAGTDPAEAPAEAIPTGLEVEVQGRVICLAEVFHSRYQTELAGAHEHLFGFEARVGTIYTLLRTKFSEALFIDPQLRKKELLLKGRVFPHSQTLEVTRIRSVREGVVYDLYYYCTVCSIETVSAGPCACCQGSVELHEVPLRQPVSGGSRKR